MAAALAETPHPLPYLDFLTDARVPQAEMIGRNVLAILKWQELAQQAGSYACLLTGAYKPISGPLENQGEIDTAATLTDMGLYEPYLFKRPDGRTLATMAGYNRLVRSEWQTRAGGSPGGHPFDKFYLSLDLTGPERIAQGMEFFRAIVRGAQDRGALLATKAYPLHAYDALLLYTYRPHSPIIAGILQELYPEYNNAGLFHSTTRFFQGEITGIPGEHIGFVHEPSYSAERQLALGSHSQRMWLLGKHIDELGPDVAPALIVDAFTAAATHARVEPARPYLVPERAVA